MDSNLATKTQPTKRGPGRPKKHIETPDEKFARLAASRLDRAVSDMRLIGNLCSSAYKHKATQIDAIERRLLAEVDQVISRLRGTHPVNFLLQ